MATTRKQDPVKHCKACGKPLTRKRINGRLEDRSVFLKRKYCDRNCMATGQMKDNPSLAAYRKRAISFRGNKCEECGATENLDIHHMNSDPSDNSPQNLKTLCSSCHQKWHWKHGRKLPKRQTTCTVCGDPARKLDMCQKHYQRFKKYGNAHLTKKRRGSSYVITTDIERV